MLLNNYYFNALYFYLLGGVKLLTNFYELTQLGIASAEVDDRAGVDNSIVGIVCGQHIVVTLSIRTAGTGCKSTQNKHSAPSLIFIFPT